MGASPTRADPGSVDRAEVPAVATRRVIEMEREARRRIPGIDRYHEARRPATALVGDASAIGPDDPQRPVAEGRLGRSQPEHGPHRVPKAGFPAPLVPREGAAAVGVVATGQPDLVAVVDARRARAASAEGASRAGRRSVPPPSIVRSRGVSCEPSRLSWTATTSRS